MYYIADELHLASCPGTVQQDQGPRSTGEEHRPDRSHRARGEPPAGRDLVCQRSVPAPEELQAIVGRWKADGVQGFFTYTWNCCGDPETLANHPELWDTWRRENSGL